MKEIKPFIISIIIIVGLFFAIDARAQVRIFTPSQGGTGLGSATAGDVSKCLTVLDDSPFAYAFATCGSGGGIQWPFTKLSSNEQATSTIMSWLGGQTSASSTFTGAVTIVPMTSAILLTGAGGLVAEYTGATCTNQFVRILSALGAATCETVDISSDTNLTAGIGITLTGDDLSIDTSQNIATLSNLTSNGFVKTSGGVGTLSVDTTTYESGLTAGDGLTRTANDFDCDTASGSVFGCLSSTDWTTFNNKLGAMTFAWPFTLQAGGEQATTTVMEFVGGLLSNATSTFSATTSMSALNFNATDVAVSNSESVGGVLNVNRGTDLGAGIVAYNNTGAGGGRLGSFVCDNTAHDTNCLHVRSDSTVESTLNILGSPQGKGIVKIGSNGVGDANGSLLSLDASLASYLGQSIFVKCGTSAICIQLRNSADATKFLIDDTGATTFYSSTTLQNFTATNGTTTDLAVSSDFTMSGITSAIPLTNTVGQVSEYAGTSCTNQFIRVLSAIGGATCATVASTDVDSSIALSATTITVAGTANQITSSAGAQSLAANRTWTLSLANPTVMTNSSSTLLSTTIASTSQLMLSGKKDAILTVDANGWVVASSTIGNNQLQNSTISGVALGGTLSSLTNDATLNGSAYNGSAAISDWSLNLGNANNWSALQTFTNATATNFSSTIASTSQLILGGLANGCLNVTGGNVGSTACGGSSFAWPFTKQAGNEQSTTTVMEFVGGFLSNASSTVSDILATGHASSTGNLFAGGNVNFNGELLPDGLTCSNGQILKKTGTDNWDCAADADSGGATAWNAIGDATVDGAIGMAETVQTLDWNTAAVTALEADYLTLTATVDAATDIVTQRLLTLSNPVGTTGTLEVFQRITNAGTTVPTGLIIDGAGAITTAIDVADADIVTALSTGANDLSGTNWSITGASGLGVFANATATNFSSTIASTSQLQLSGKKDAILSVDANGWVVASSSIGNNQLQNSALTANTAAPLGGGGAVSLGGTLNLTCTGCLTGMTFAWPFTKQAGGEQATSTIMEFVGGFLSNASSTMAAASSTVSFESPYYYGSSVTATSTFLGPMQFGSTTGDSNLISITAQGNHGASNSTGGLFKINNTQNQAAAIMLYTNKASGALAPLFQTRVDNSAFDFPGWRLDYDGTNDGLVIAATAAASNAISISNTGVDHTFVSSYTGSTADKGAMNLTSTNTAGSVFQISGSPVALGVGKITHSGVGDANSSVLSLAGTNAGYLGQGMFIDIDVSSDEQKILNIRGDATEELVLTRTGLTISGNATTTNFLALGSTTLQAFTSTKATTTDLHVSGKHITFNGNTGYVSATTSPSLRIASTTLGQEGNSFSIGTTTVYLGTWPERRIIRSARCFATSTAATGFLFRMRAGDVFDTTQFCDNSNRQIAIGFSVAPFTPVYVVVSKASTTPNFAGLTFDVNKLSD